ncbi:MAG: PQQ-dependent sugar dehydrogenase [Chitinophagaceae bacterium]|nr:PQQ-dependent sugar dehydrogenase [Chitinophagaceae bacterium]
MKKIVYMLALLIALKASSQSEPFTTRTVVSGLDRAWEMLYGPNGTLWITENRVYKLSTINIASGTKTVLLDLVATGEKTFPATGTQPQGGMMGMAIHPNLYSSDPTIRALKPWVYIAYVYARGAVTNCPNPGPSCPFSTRIVRYTWNGTTLSSPVTILDNMPGSSDHNSGRLVLSPVSEPGVGGGLNSQMRLYYSIGDMGAGQLTNNTRTNNAQNIDVLEGKILRLNSETDGDAGLDAWVPDDNPYYDASAITPQDYVYSYGHRNPQGLVWGWAGGAFKLYSAEHSDRADDELNYIQSTNNYGWDKVSGKCDGDVNGFKIGGTTVANEVTNCTGTTQPMFTFFHNNTTWPSTYPANGSSNAQWPSAAISSIAFYGSVRIPGWQNSIFVTPLKENLVYRMKLSADGTTITGDTVSYFRGGGTRIRRIIVGPDAQRFYVARDAGTIVEYTYTGAITLPVKLLSFRGALQNSVSNLQWATGQETNTLHFIVERSINGTDYTSIGTVGAIGNSNTKLEYTYKDNGALNQPATVLYYRLKMVDKDGEYTYSNVITISLAPAGGRVVVSPNPVHDEAKVAITTTGEGEAQWKMVDNTGRIVLHGKKSLMPGTNQMTINTGKLSAGVYYLRVQGAGIDRQVKLQKL